MKAFLGDANSGAVNLYDVPVPELRSGGILIRTAYSAISSGTEKATLETGQKSLVGKALARPDLVKQVLDYAKQNGVKAAYQRVQSRLGTLTPLGYSCSGTVLAVTDDVTDFRPGDRVACGGVGFATHSEFNFVPRNLAVKIPDNVPFDQAALTTIGAIAMQGLRQAQIAFGETVAIVGAGLIGVLAIQIARAAGCRVVAIDRDPGRVERALAFGAHAAFPSDDPSTVKRIQQFSRHGVDAAVVCASAKSSAPVELAAELLRDRGRLAVVGAVGLGVSRNVMYHKELSLALSRSYGPGRYDPNYEENGNDYPIGYVRWTERRNMEAFTDLLSSGALDVAPLISLRFPAEEGANAWASLNASAYTALIQYQAEGNASLPAPVIAATPRSTDQVRVGCIGAGGFASGVIFPTLRQIKAAVLESVATQSGHGAASAKRAFHFQRTQTPSELVADAAVDAVFVLTRHDSHARMVLEAMSRQKPVFVEKPLAVKREELDAIREQFARQQQLGHEPFVMVGFNRRFSPATEAIREFFAGHREPMAVTVRVNAGFIPADHWTQRDAGGGRIVGEFCHFVDWVRSVVGKPIVRVSAVALPDGSRYNRDNIAVTLVHSDGSFATLVYVANGDSSVPKEQFEVFCEGAVARLNDFRKLELVRNGKTRTLDFKHDKGHRRELELTIDSIRQGGASPIPFAELVEVTAACLAVQDSISTGIPVSELFPPAPKAAACAQ
ncbi:MAG TPA: bi-domain-containing oxidoreductase [Terriglobales bacterium]|nr:bi-domain-containing oxidoreductase [Terriglobales bacterium]